MNIAFVTLFEPETFSPSTLPKNRDSKGFHIVSWFDGGEESYSEGESAKAAYARVQTAAKQLVAAVKPDKVAQLSPMQVQKLRQVLQPLIKWLDASEVRKNDTEPVAEKACNQP